eukprot:403358905
MENITEQTKIFEQTRVENSEKILYSKAYSEFKEDKFEYFDKVGQSLPWIQKYTKIYEQVGPFYKWYADGLTNACYTSLDVHVEQGRGDEVAILDLHPVTQVITRYSYRDLYERCGRLATNLKTKFGLEQGDRAIILSYNNLDALIMTLACARIGVMFQTVHHAASARELSTKIDELTPKVFFTVSEQVSPLGAVSKTKPLIEETLLLITNPEIAQNLKFIYSDGSRQPTNDIPDQWVAYNSLISEDVEISPCTPLSPQAPIIIINTSGSTGKPKFVVRSHLAAIAPSISLRNNYNLQHQDVIGAFSAFGYSLYYQFQSFGALTNGNQILLFSGNVTLLPIMDLIQDLKINLILSFSAPFQVLHEKKVVRELENKEGLKCLRSIIVTGEKSPPAFLEAIKSIFPYARLSDQYGTCEATVITSNLLNTDTYSLDEGQSYTNQGWPLLGVDLVLLDNNGNEINEPNVEGNVVIKLPGPLTLLTEIYQDRETTINKFYKEYPGYFRIGDLGQWDNNKCFHFLRRKEDIIYVNHVECSAKFLQDILLKVEGVKEAMLASNLQRDQCYAFIATAEENRTEDFKQKLLKTLFDESNGVGKLGGIIFINKLPQTSNGKTSMELMKCLLNNQSLNHMPVGNQADVDLIKNQVQEQVGNVNDRY